MSGFEFVLVLFAIIAGLGISDILSGWGEQIRARHRMSAYPLQIALSGVLICLGMSFLWSLWTFRDVVWSFPIYVSVATIPLIISLVSRVARVDTSIAASSPREQYFQNARPVFLLLSVIPAMIALLALTTSLGEGVPDRPNIIYLTTFRVALCIGLFYVAWSKNVIVHWVGVCTFLLVVLMLGARLTVREIGGAF